jgi:hypothetical protein
LLSGLATAAGAATRALGAALNSPAGLVTLQGVFLFTALLTGSNVLGNTLGNTLGNHIRGAADVHGKHVRSTVKQGTGVLGTVYAGVEGLRRAVLALFKVRALAQPHQTA